MSEAPPQAPLSNAVAQSVEAGGAKVLKGLDQAKIQNLGEFGRTAQETGEGIEAHTAEYFASLDKFLQTTDQEIQDLDAEWAGLGDDSKAFATGLDKLRHVTAKDLDKIAGQQCAVNILEAAHLQVQQGLGDTRPEGPRVTAEDISAKTNEAQKIWAKLTPTARAQVLRGLRASSTMDGWNNVKTTIADWTTEQFRPGKKADFGQVMSDTAGRLRKTAEGIGTTDLDSKIGTTISTLKNQITTDQTRITQQIDTAVAHLQEGVGIFSADPQQQKLVSEHLTRLNTVKAAYNEAINLSGATGQMNELTVGYLTDIVANADQIITVTDQVFSDAGVRGWATGIAPEVLERRAVVGTSGLGETAVKLRSALEILNKQGLVARDFSVRIGTLDIDFNSLLAHAPLLTGLKEARAIIQARASEQLDAVYLIMSGDFAKSVKPSLDAWLSPDSTVDQQLEANRALKEAGMETFLLDQFQTDAAGMATMTEPTKGMSDKRKKAWQELHTIAGTLHKELIEVSSEKIKANESNTAAVARFAMESLRAELADRGYADEAANVQALFDDQKWVDFVTSSTPGRLGKWLRKTTGAFRGMSPGRTTGVRIDDDGAFQLAGISGRVASELTALQVVSQTTDRPLRAALANGKNLATIHADLARLNSRNGHADWREHLRVLISKQPELFGMGGTVGLIDTMNRTHAESVLLWLAGGTAAALAAPFVADGVASLNHVFAGMDQSGIDAAKMRLAEAAKWLDLLGRTSVDGAQVTGPDAGTNGDLINVMMQAGTNGLEGLKTQWQGTQGAMNEQISSLTQSLAFHLGIQDSALRLRDITTGALRNPITAAGLAGSLAAGMAGLTKGAEVTARGGKGLLKRVGLWKK